MKKKSKEEQLAKIDFLEDVSFENDTANFKISDVLVVLRRWDNGPWDSCMCSVRDIKLDKDRVATWNETKEEWYYFNPSKYSKYGVVIKILERKS